MSRHRTGVMLLPLLFAVTAAKADSAYWKDRDSQAKINDDLSDTYIKDCTFDDVTFGIASMRSTGIYKSQFNSCGD